MEENERTLSDFTTHGRSCPGQNDGNIGIGSDSGNYCSDVRYTWLCLRDKDNIPNKGDSTGADDISATKAMLVGIISNYTKCR